MKRKKEIVPEKIHLLERIKIILIMRRLVF